MKRTVFALIVAAVAGCYNEKVEVRGYIDKTVSLIQESRQIGTAFGTRIGPWLAGQQVDVGQLNRELETTKRRYYEIHDEIRRLRCPNNRLALEYQKELLAYIDLEEDWFANDLTSICNTIASNNPADPTTIYIVQSRIHALTEESLGVAERLAVLASRAGSQW